VPADAAGWVAGAAGWVAGAVGKVLPVFLTPTAPPRLPVVLVHCPLTLSPNICRYPLQLITDFSLSISLETAKSKSEVMK
jgi:hypothetical protein